jgi:hypothetical protein
MMNYVSKLIIVTALVAVTALGVSSVNAQSVTMPALYDQSGTQVNSANSTSRLQAGTYYLNNNGTNEVYYYGNGNYYDPRTMTYWGTNTNSNGAAGTGIINLSASLAQTNTNTNTGNTGTGDTTTGSDTTLTPGVPNTGAGGAALTNWLLLIGSISALSLIVYASRRTA